MNKLTLFALLLGLCVGASHAGQPEPLVLVKAISLGAVDGRLDHLCVDPQNERLYVAALTKDSIEVVDLKLGKHERSVPGLGGPQGVAVVPTTQEVVVGSGEDGVCRIYDRTLNLVRILSELPDSDCVRYDIASQRVYLGYGNALAEIDPAGPTKKSEVPLEGHPESFQIEKNGNRIFVNVPQSREVVIIDRNSAKITARWPVLEARENFPMALDEKNHRLFVGCRKPAKVLIYDTTYGSYIGKVDCVGDADDLYYDSERRMIYVTGGQGYITVINEVDPYLYKVVANISTSPGARTSYFEPAAATLYVAVPERRDQPAGIWAYKVR
jgi:DNA-binding beta-propeller fold protein YncE